MVDVVKLHLPMVVLNLTDLTWPAFLKGNEVSDSKSNSATNA